MSASYQIKNILTRNDIRKSTFLTLDTKNPLFGEKGSQPKLKEYNIYGIEMEAGSLMHYTMQANNMNAIESMVKSNMLKI